MLHDPKGKGGVVPDRLNPGDGPPSLQECLRPGSSAQLRPLHGAGLPANHLPDGAQAVPRVTQEVTSEAAEGANEGGRRIHGPEEGRPESEGARGETERVDIGGDVDTCRRESLCALGPGERAGINKTTGTRHQGELGGRSETARRRGGGRGGGAGWGGPTPHQGGLEQNTWAVHSCTLRPSPP